MKKGMRREVKARFGDAINSATAKGPRAITVNGKFNVRFKAIKWQDYVGICEGIVSDHIKSKQKERTEEELKSRSV